MYFILTSFPKFFDLQLLSLALSNFFCLSNHQRDASSSFYFFKFRNLSFNGVKKKAIPLLDISKQTNWLFFLSGYCREASLPSKELFRIFPNISALNLFNVQVCDARNISSGQFLHEFNVYLTCECFQNVSLATVIPIGLHVKIMKALPV